MTGYMLQYVVSSILKMVGQPKQLYLEILKRILILLGKEHSQKVGLYLLVHNQKNNQSIKFLYIQDQKMKGRKSKKEQR